ncbi:hypothetical protein CQY23_15050 [Mycobacterium celatum]|uniref:Uncharacterized protein n=1 Tax=Mycobacterium celatum TaxID=28045 RepID=A0A2G5PJJ6_MYCCE|nr:hypothetical protein CQY23_15050 [Mycobacterium celatum]
MGLHQPRQLRWSTRGRSRGHALLAAGATAAETAVVAEAAVSADLLAAWVALPGAWLAEAVLRRGQRRWVRPPHHIRLRR